MTLAAAMNPDTGVITAPPALTPWTPARSQEAAASLDAIIASLYTAHYQPLVRLAAMLTRDLHAAEEIAQDAFVALHAAWPRLRDPERALAYLRQSVINGSRTALRRRQVADRYAVTAAAPPAEQPVQSLLDRYALQDALRALPARQREAIVLRYYADLSEGDTAAAMGISRGALKSHTFRAMTSLRKALEPVA